MDHALPNWKPGKKKTLHSLLTCFLISIYYTTESNTLSEVSQTLMGSFTCPEINGRKKQCNSWGQKSNKTELSQCQGKDTTRINMSQRQSSILSASREINKVRCHIISPPENLNPGYHSIDNSDAISFLCFLTAKLFSQAMYLKQQ